MTLSKSTRRASVSGLTASRFSLFAILALALASFTTNSLAQAQENEEAFILQAEDLLRISFPGAPELDTELQVRRDGVISVPIIGEVKAAGKTPKELETFLEDAMESQLVSNEVLVTVVESHFTYYMEGEVNAPGIITSFRQLSVLEAIIAAGGINKTSGKLNSVVVMRRKGDTYQRFELDLKAVLDGKKSEAFVLQSYDVVSVPQRVW
ncbi:polysaccharide biosynthesis/export family protein [Pelagicoccus sp. SDUM812003]|uniref:polysaccharide biosynthesis/export family protein n=1 Tax=Pelagicoccus sp. SDUM812003 TaxID=3041267 RepID=UPI00280D8941|nr:polysaccharide biosynthesis/export family protein [Pelagicoccus sp. SDUM812003]MDQ8205192.1 polysaccharide biosynthesis/export family protein [Pelagicoccus sp. SDUM812003]